MRIYTGQLSSGESLTIDEDMNVVQLSVAGADSSAVFTVTGDLPIGANDPTACSISGQNGFSIRAENQTSPLQGVTIACSAGTVNVFLSQA